MVLVTFIRLLKYSIQGFFRNFWLSFVCITTMVIAFILVDVLGGIMIISNKTIDSIKNKIDVSIYLDKDLSEDRIFLIKDDLSKLKEIKEVIYISKEDALENFKKKHSNNDVLISSINTLSENPIGATIILRAKAIEDYSIILDYVSTFKYKDFIENTDYTDNRLIINKMNNLNTSISKALILISLFFCFISSVTVINTLRITIYSRRKEIEIMRILGASWAFIKIPFIVEGVFYLLAGWFLSVIVFYCLLIFLTPYINLFFNFYDNALAQSIMTGSIKLILLQFVIGLVITIFSSVMSIRKYAKV